MSIMWASLATGASPQEESKAARGGGVDASDTNSSTQRYKLFGAYGFVPRDLAPVDRQLYLHEMDDLVWASQTLVDKRLHDLNDRMAVHAQLQKLHHVYGLPALLAVAEDAEDAVQLRLLVVRSLSTYPARYVAPPLIALVGEPEHRVAETAHQALYYLSGRPAEKKDLSLPEQVQDRQEIIQSWQSWWSQEEEKHRKARGGYGGGGYGEPTGERKQPPGSGHPGRPARDSTVTPERGAQGSY